MLPPTVIGFYLLLTMGPNGYFGQFTQWLGLGTLTFSFAGLVIGSVIYSMPFVVQPLQNAFSAIGTRPLEVAATLRARNNLPCTASTRKPCAPSPAPSCRSKTRSTTTSSTMNWPRR